MRKKIVAGNWKMNKTLTEAGELTSEVMTMLSDEVTNGPSVILCVPFPFLMATRKQLGKDVSIAVGAQDCSAHEAGAYTGEVSAPMIASTGATHVIIGHSERRQYHGEQAPLLSSKINCALAAGLVPIFCCGELLEIREQNGHEQVVREQVADALFHLSGDAFKNLVIAYEPVWAIGTGRTATAAQAQEMHAVVRQTLASKYGPDVAYAVPILYGGSVKADNAREIFASPDVDGGLVGGASLKAREFVEIVKAAT